MRLRKALGALALLTLAGQSFLPSGPPQFDWYADSVNGNDSNNCTSLGTACKTLTHMLALAGSAANNRFCLVNGSHFGGGTTGDSFALGTLAAPVSGTTISNCGPAGARPIVDAAVQLVAGNWSKTGGRTNVYQQSVTLPSPPDSGGDFPLFFENGTLFRFVADQATVDATASSYTIPSVQAGSGEAAGGADTLYIHTSDGSNPASNGKTYTWGGMACAFCVEGSNITVSGVEGRNAALTSGSCYFPTGTGLTLTDVICRNGNRHNALVGLGAVLNQPQFIDAYWGPFATANMLVLFQQTGNGGNFNLTGSGTASGNVSTFSQSVNIAAMVAPTQFFAHVNAGAIGAISIDRIKATVSNGAKLDGISTGNNESSLTLSNSYMNGVNSGATVNGPLYTLSNDQIISSFSGNQPILAPNAGQSLTINNTKICGTSTAHGNIDAEANNLTITISGLVSRAISSSGDVNFAHIKLGAATGVAITMNGSTWDDGGVDNAWRIFSTGSGNTFTGGDTQANANQYGDLQGSDWKWNNSNVANGAGSIAAWQTASGHDAASVASGDASPACTPPA